MSPSGIGCRLNVHSEGFFFAAKLWLGGSSFEERSGANLQVGALEGPG